MTKKLFSVLAAASAVALSAQANELKYIFYYIGDGMGMGPSVAAEMYNRHTLGNSTPITMMQFPVAGMCLTYSTSSPVTDSAAAGTALATGVKTKNGMLGMGPDTVAVKSIAKDLQDAGYGIGIITSVGADDATPGAFYAHVPNRGMRYEIDLDAAASGYQFISGAGFNGLYKDGVSTGALEAIKDAGYTVVYGPEQMERVKDADKIMLFNTEGCSTGDFAYTIDSVGGFLTLPYITEKCLSHLEKQNPEAFFMMVEGGNIDHALHANDGGTAIKEIIKFNEALDVAYDFYKQHPDETLIVVTADHDTGGMSIGNSFTGYNANLGNIDYQKVSKEAFQTFCKSLLESRRTFTWDDMQQYLAENLGFGTKIKLTQKQEEKLKRAYDDVFMKHDTKGEENTLYANFNSFASLVFKIFNDQAGIGFIASSHTGNPVPVFAVGVGAERFTNLNNNSEIPVAIMDIVNANLNK